MAARELALSDGLPAITLSGIAAKIAVARALVNHYVPSMDALVANTFTAIVEAELADTRAHLKTLTTATDQLRWLVATMLDEGRDDVTKVWIDSWSVGRRSNSVGAAVEQMTNKWISTVAEVIRCGVSNGEFTSSSPHDVAWQVLGMVGGLNAQAAVQQGGMGAPPGLVARALERELGLASGALRPPDNVAEH